MFDWLPWRRRKVDGAFLADFTQTRVDGYVDCLERLDVTIEIVDENELPYPKGEILDALCLLVGVGDRTEARAQSILTLAQFQKGVGPRRLRPSDAAFYGFNRKVASEIVTLGERIKKASAATV